nr:C-type lectin domain family 4 member A-like [Marmota flaviventris]
MNVPRLKYSAIFTMTAEILIWLSGRLDLCGPVVSHVFNLRDPRENTIPLQSNFGFSKLLLALLLILFLLKEILLSVSFITFFLKNSQLLKEKNYESSTKEMIHTNLECVKINSTMKGKVWSC